MRAATLIPFLFGSRRAIVEIASARSALLTGMLLVISAGVAREYDGESFWHEPWHLLRPLGASLVAGTVLFLVVHGAATLRRAHGTGPAPALGTAYARFIAVFWMTAPLAWIYAVPYERWMAPADAITANLLTLAVVSAWRVVLITRAVSVLYGMLPLSALVLVLLFADAVVLFATTAVPIPVIDLMGGVRTSDREELIGLIALLIRGAGILAAPALLLSAIAAVCTLYPTWFTPSQPDTPQPRGARRLAWIVLLLWLPVLAVTQPQQWHRHRAEHWFRADQPELALAEMSTHARNDYPPGWIPPPPVHGGGNAMALVDVLRRWGAQPMTPWVRDHYVAKSDRALRYLLGIRTDHAWRNVAIARADPGVRDAQTPLRRVLLSFLLRHDASLTDADRAALESLLDALPDASVRRDSETA